MLPTLFELRHAFFCCCLLDFGQFMLRRHILPDPGWDIRNVLPAGAQLYPLILPLAFHLSSEGDDRRGGCRRGASTELPPAAGSVRATVDQKMRLTF